MKLNKKGGPKPVRCWGVFDPAGKLRALHVRHPGASARAWVWKADQPDRRGNAVYMPDDDVAARKAGYRLKPLRAVPL